MRFQRSGLPKEFLETTQKSGTLRDQIGALVTIVEEGPLYRLKELTSLTEQLEKKTKRVRLLIFPALKDLFVQTLLPDRYLVHFSQRNFDLDTLTKRHLIYAIYESHLKELYQRFLLCLEELSQDPLEYPRNMALKLAKELVERKPEGERFLLALIINKMGDPSKTIASKSSYFLHQILFRHPHMKVFIAKEVMQFCVRPNLPLRAKHYALNFLSLLRFSRKEDKEFLQSLLSFYLAEFHRFVDEKKKQQTDTAAENFSKPIVYLLQGIKRCVLFLEEQELGDNLKKELSSIFQVAKSDTDSDWLAALELLFMLRKVDVQGSEGFGKVIYQRVFDALHLSVQKQERFLKLVSDSLKSDSVIERVGALTKRLLQAALDTSPSFAGACLLAVCNNNAQVELKGKLSCFIRFPEQGREDEDSNTANDTSNLYPEYNAYVMNPLKANASASCFWELELLRHHFHPSVAIFASKMLNVCEIPPYSGNALKDFSLASFLETFSQRKPKTGVVHHLKGVSAITAPKVFKPNTEGIIEDSFHSASLLSEIGHKKLNKAQKRKHKEIIEESDDEELDEEFERHIRHKFGNSLDPDDWNDPEEDASEVDVPEEEDEDDAIANEVRALMEEPLDDFIGKKGHRRKRTKEIFAPAEEYEI